jgi:hypothetical protein
VPPCPLHSSPDLPPEQLAMVYEGDVDTVDFGPALDELLVSGITADWRPAGRPGRVYE